MDLRAALRLRRPAADPASDPPRPRLTSTSQAIHIPSRSRISLQLVEREYKESGGVYRIGWANLTQRAWLGQAE
jgi:hypothetical protein